MWKNIAIGVAAGLFLAVQISLWTFYFSPSAEKLISQSALFFLKDVLGPFSSSLFGAIAGACAAFWFQTSNERKKELREAYRILAMTKLDYQRKIQYLVAVKKKSIELYKDHEFRFLAILELPETPRTAGLVGQEIVTYLMERGATGAVAAVLNANHNYSALFDNAKGRNKTYLSYRDILHRSDRSRSFQVDFPYIVSVVEPGRIVSVYNTTENLLAGFDVTIRVLRNALVEVGGVLDAYFEKKGFPVIKLDELEEGSLESLPPPVHDLESLKRLIEEINNANVRGNAQA